MKRSATRVRVQLDVVLDVPGEGIEVLEDAPLSHALIMGLRAMGYEVERASGGHRRLLREGRA